MSWSRKPLFWRRTEVRLTLWYAWAVLAVLSLACGFLGYRLHKDMMKQADAILVDEAREIEALLLEAPEMTWMGRYKAELAGRTRLRIHFRILDGLGGELASSSPKFPWTDVPSEAGSWKGTGAFGFRSLQWRKLPYRELTLRLKGSDGPLFLQLGMDLKQVRNAMMNFYGNVLILIPAALSLCALGGWILARRSLSPIKEIASTASRISSSNLDERLRKRGSGDELDELVSTINSMLDRLNRAFEEIGKFSADVAHEIRTPLCAMRGEAELVLRGTHTAQEYQEVLERFTEQFDRLSRLTGDLLLLARLEATAHVEHPERLELGSLLGGLVELFEALAEDKGISMRLLTEGETAVWADKCLVQQALANLIHNALQYTPKGGRVHLKCTAEGAWALISIEDTGMGIPPQDLPHVFDRFYRVEKSRSRETGGSGLGLSISKRIVEAHGGEIRIESTWGRGTRVQVRLPRVSGGVSS